MEFDQFIITYIGSLGRWQLWVFALVSLVALGNGLITVSQTFVLYMPAVRCQVPGCDPEATNLGIVDANHTDFSIPYWGQSDLNQEETGDKRCSRFRRYDEHSIGDCSADSFENQSDYTSYYYCDRYQHIYDYDDMENSYVMEFDLVDCSNLYPDWPFDPFITKVSFLGMAYMFGNLFGAFFCGYFADRYGRLPVMMISVISSSLWTLASSFVDGFWAWWTCRLMAGLTSKGLFMSAMVIATEIVGPQWRMTLGILIEVPYAIGEMLSALFAYLFQDWRDYQIAISVVTLSLVCLWLIVPESPRWLVSNGQTEKARKILKKAAKMNRKDISDQIWEKTEFQDQSKLSEVKRLGFLHLFSNIQIARNSVVMFANWLVANLVYYALSLNSVNLSGNTYANFALSAFVEIPSYIFLVLVMDGWGRKPVLCFCQLLAGVTCVVAGFDIPDWLTTTMTLLGKFGASAAFAVVYLYTAELYPTIIRSTAVGASSTWARLGGVFAPILAGLKPPNLGFFIMGGSALVGGTLAMLLPETLGTPLPDTLEDVQRLGQDAKPWYKWMSKKELERRRLEYLEKLSANKDTDDGDLSSIHNENL